MANEKRVAADAPEATPGFLGESGGGPADPESDARARRWIAWHREQVRFKLRRRLPKKRFLRALRKCTTLREILSLLMRAGRAYGVKRIRCFRHVQGEDKLVSVECVGHGQRKSLQLRLGNIFKFSDREGLESREAFLCLESKGPVVFQVNRSSPTSAITVEERELGEDHVLIVRLSKDPCYAFFGTHRKTIRVDLPLLSGGEIMGKLSCDFDFTEVPANLEALLQPFWNLVKLATDAIELRRQHEVRVVDCALEGVPEAIRNLQSFEELSDYCVGELANRFKCRFASLLTVSTDALGCSKLVLRKTSYGPSRCLEHGAGVGGRVGYYTLSPRLDLTITTWVATSGRPLRLQHLDDPRLRDQQLRMYDERIQWRNLVADSDNHTSFLAVPLNGSGETLGVLRFTEKKAGESDSYFTETEERQLSRIARDWITPKLHDLRNSEVARRLSTEEYQDAVSYLSQMYLSALRHGPRAQESEKWFGRAMNVMYPRAQAHRLYLFNVLGHRTPVFEHRAVAGELRSGLTEGEGANYDLAGSFTDRLLQQGSDQPLFLIDLPYAHEQGAFKHIVPETVCALGCVVPLGGNRRGVLVIKSDRYDIMPEFDASVLRPLATSSAKLLRCQPWQLRSVM